MKASVKRKQAIACIFLDIGGVLLTNGWDHLARRRAAKHFKLKWTEMEDRHNLNFATYEEGKLTLEEYLGRVVFYQKRAFTRAQFRALHVCAIKTVSRYDRAVRSAQGPIRIEDRRGQQRSARTECLSDSQVQAGPVGGCLCFLLLRPYPQARRGHLSACARHRSDAGSPRTYIEDTPLFVQIAEGFGIRSILPDYKSTCAKLASLGLQND